MSRHPVISIDGPAGTGKTTSAREVARRIGFAYIDSGALYRAIALAAAQEGIGDPDDPRVAGILERLPVEAEPGVETFRVRIGGVDVTSRLRDPEVTSLASKLAVRPDVRARVGEWLRSLASLGPAVVEGRDIGTAVFPDADLKIFMTAELDERARRRLTDLESQGISTDLDDVTRTIRERDLRDASRDLAPLRMPAGAVRIDTTNTSVEGQVWQILDAWRKRVGPHPGFVYAIEQRVIRLAGRLLWRLRAEGTENVPPIGGAIIASNHKSYLDPPLIGAVIPRQISYVAKKELFRIPIVGAWMRWTNVIPIDREGFDRVAIARALDRLARGDAILLFPEGTRIRRPGFGPPREGIALLAARAKVPIVPVHVRGSWHVERGRWIGGEVRIRFGRPIRFPEVPEGRRGRLLFPSIAERIMAEIAALAGD